MSSTSHTPSLEYLNTVWQYLPQGHEKALKQAFYNTIANIFVVIAAVVAVTVYFILAPFIRPLIWAVLCGTFLYPFKRSLTNVLRQWLKGLNMASTPFGVGLAILPLQLSNSFAELVTSIIWANIKVVFGLFFGLPILYWIYYFTPVRDAGPLLLSFIGWLYEFLEYFSSKWVWTFFAGYLIGVAILWKPVPSSQRWLRFLSAPAWVSMLLHFANAAGPLRVPLFILMIISIILGAVFRGDADYITSDSSSASESQKAESTTSQFDTTVGTKAVDDNNDENKEAKLKLHPVSAVLHQSPVIQAPTDQTAATNINTSSAQLSSGHSSGIKPSSLLLSTSHGHQARPSGASGAKQIQSTNQQDTKTSMVDQCFMTLFWGHVIVRIWMHVWLMCLLLLLPILHVAVRKIVKQFCPGGIFHMTATNFKNAVYQWFLVRQEVLMPRCLKGLWKLIVKGDQQVIVFLEQGLDQATSILFILMMLVGTVLFSVIAAVQVQRETMHMVSAAQNLLNKTSTEFSTFMPNAEMMRKTMDQVLEKTHQHGRNFIASKVREFLPVDQDSAETENITNQVLEMWDKLYETMLQREEASNSTQSKSESPLAYLWQAIQNGKAIQLSGVVEFVKENLDTFMSVWESVWTIMKNNLNLFLTVVTTILSALLGGGTAILNFVISAIIFLTTLFYLLASSGDTYKPAELFSRISPGSAGSRFGSAVEHAISGVFKASLKMAAFYGLHTWLVHLIFGLDIVFIPSALAAMFAAVPFLSPYWASLPAVIELWLVENDGVSALLLFLAHMAPVYVVDAAIYREIEGSHPYVTGLAIAGGMLLLGLEGAIIGPIILCCLIVVLNMYGSMLQNEPTTPSPGL